MTRTLPRFPHILFVAALLIPVATAQAATITFSNPAPITIPAFGNGVPYPSTIAVAGMSTALGLITVTLHGFSHTFPDDVGVMLVGPTGAGTILFDGGTTTPIAGANLTFADGGVPWPGSGPVGSGTYQPRAFYTGDTFPAPAPVIPGVNPTVAGIYTFNVFLGTNPNGVWSLYVRDFVSLDGGVISGGWSIRLTDQADVIPEPSTLALLGIGLAGFAARRKASKNR